MILDDDSDPKSKKPKPRDLSNLSVAELSDYVRQMKEEIVRVEAEIGKKEKHKSAMDSLFSRKE